MRMSGVHGLSISLCPNVAGWPENHAQRLMSRSRCRIHAPRLADKLARDPYCCRLVCELGHVSDGLQPRRRKLGRARKMVRDLSTKQFTVGQSRDRTRERLWRQLSQPQRQAGVGRRFGEGTAIDHARERARGIEPGPRDGEREEKRWKARGEVRNARVPHCQGVAPFPGSGDDIAEADVPAGRNARPLGEGPARRFEVMTIVPQARTRRPRQDSDSAEGFAISSGIKSRSAR